MMGPAPECPACRVRMEEGHVLTDIGGHVAPPHWYEGPAEKGGMHGYKIKGKRRFPVATWRCPRCSWLLWFAPEPENV